MTKNVKSLKQKVQVLNERAILALKNGKESLAAEFSLQYENTKAQLDMAEKKDSKADASIEVSGTLNDTKDEMNEFIESVSKEDALARLKARVAES